MEEETDVSQLNFNASYIAEALCFITKLLPFIKKGVQIRRCIRYFGNPYFRADNEEQKNIIDDCIKTCKWNFLAFITSVTVVIVGCLIRPVFSTSYALPFDIWLPLDPTQEAKLYYPVYILVSIASAYTAMAGTLVDPLIGGLAYHAASQLKVLKYNLTHLTQSVNSELLKMNKQITLEEKFELIRKKIDQCIQHHITILTFVKEYEDCFSFAVFSQFAGSAFVTCFCCLQISMMHVLDFNSLVSLGAIGVVLGQIYFYCYYGTILFEENNSLITAVYTGQWYEYDVKSRKNLIILMECSKKPIVVSAGKILDLSLNSFSTILKRTYSLLAVLRNYY